MPDHDDADVLARFRQRMAGIEAHVPEPPTPPPFRASVSTRAIRSGESTSGARTALSLVAAVVFVAIAVLAVPLLGRFAPGVDESPSVPSSDVAASAAPSASPEPMCGFVDREATQGPTVYQLQDETGLITRCTVFYGTDLGTGEEIELTNPGGDLRVLEARWLEGACGDRTVRFGGGAGGYELTIAAQPIDSQFECPAIGFPYGARFELAGDVPADRVRGVYQHAPPTTPPTVSPTPTAIAIPVPTHASPPPGSPQPCPAALIQGHLVADEQWGIALRVEDGSVVKVIWPYGYVARADGDRLALVDGSGQVVAREGDHVEIGGGFSGGDWFACGGHVAILSGEPTPTPKATLAPSSTPADPTPLVPGTAGWVGPTRIATEHYDFARLVVDAQGYAHIAAVTADGIVYLTNATGAWTAEQVTAVTGDDYDGEPSIVTTDDGSVTVAFARFSALRCTTSCEPIRSRGIFTATNAAGTWSDPVAVIEGRVQQPSLQAADGRLHVAYSRGDPGERSVFYASQEGDQWVTERIGEGDAPSLRTGSDGLPRIAYLDGESSLALAEPETLGGSFVSAALPGRWVARTPLLALDDEDEPHIIFFNDIDQDSPSCGALHVERASGTWSDPRRIFADDEFCRVIPENVDADAAGALHVISVYDLSSNGVWYANNASGDFRALQLREPKMFTDDGPRGVSALAVDDRDRPHTIFAVSEPHLDETEDAPDDDGLWYGIGPAD